MCRNARAGLLNLSESFSSISSVPKVPRVPKARTFHKVQQSTPHKTCLGTLRRTEKPDIFEILRDLFTSLMCCSQYFRNNRRQRVSRIPTPSIIAGALASLFGRSLRATQTVHPVRPPPLHQMATASPMTKFAARVSTPTHFRAPRLSLGISPCQVLSEMVTVPTVMKFAA